MMMHIAIECNFIHCTLFSHRRMYNVSCPTSESASLRMFKYGRTDAIRATTADSLNFVQAMQDPAKKVLLNHYKLKLNVKYMTFKVPYWSVNATNRTQRGWNYCRKLLRHIRKTRTMWGLVFINISVSFFSYIIWFISVWYMQLPFFRPFMDKP